MREPDLSVEIAGISLKNPVMTASGTFGYGEEYASLVQLDRLGAVIPKGISLEPIEGNPPPRIVETAAGLLNAIGLQNVGVESFVREKLPFLKRYGTPVIVNIFGYTMEDYVRLAERLDDEGIAGLEVNISCPNVKRGGLCFGHDPRTAFEVIHGVRAKTSLPVIAKLSPNVTDISVLVRSVQDAGADAISLINTLLGMSIDVENRRSKLGNITGGLSGPAIKPVALRMVWQARALARVPIIGVGGITTAADALEFLIAGASAVQIGTAHFTHPRASLEVVDGIRQYLRTHGIARVTEIIGSLRNG
ncbi:MAG: dihydroorotate dehydrogenase [Deltaproteobacteria bacterium]|nr:dihydroorotate dehydrogenase [Deltaproteobacteria bacterium]